MVSRLDFSGMNFNFGAMDFGLSNFTLPNNFTLFTPEATDILNKSFKEFVNKPPNTPPVIEKPITTTNTASVIDSLADKVSRGNIWEVPAIPLNTIPLQPVKVRPKSLPLLPPTDPNVIAWRPERYSSKSNDYWEMKAPGSTRAIRFNFGERPANMLPVLSVDGIVVKIDFADEGGVRFDDWYLISQKTLDAVRNTSNPHYDMAQNGELFGIPLGETVPIIVIDTKAILSLMKQTEPAVKSAAIKDVIHVIEDNDLSMTIPKSLINQINWTLSTGGSRPAAEWEQYDLNLTGNYAIKQTVVESRQEDGKFNLDKMRRFLTATKDIQRGLSEDLNRIKRAFYTSNVSGFSTFRKYEEVPSDIPVAPQGSFTIIDSILDSVPNTTAPKPNAPIASWPEPDWSKSDAELISKWDSFGLTGRDKLILSNPSPAGNLTYKVGPALINIAIVWDADLCDRIRVFDTLPAKPPANISELREKMLTYFGAIKDTNLFETTIKQSDWDKYIEANNRRKAEMLYMGRLIRDLERRSGKLLVEPKSSPKSTPGGATGGSAAVTR
jgi:hypothetical protein